MDTLYKTSLPEVIYMSGDKKEEEDMSVVSHANEKYSNHVIVDNDTELQRTINWIDNPPTENDVKNSKLLNKLIQFNQKYNSKEGKMNFESSKKDT